MRDTIDMAREAGFEAMRAYGLLPHVPEDIFIANVCVTEEVKLLVALVRADQRTIDAGLCKDVIELYRGTAMGKHAELVGDDCAGAILYTGETQ
jgi:hypothetical protein